MFNIGPLELMVILVIALLVVGPHRLPEVGRSIGRGIREFRKAQDEVQKTIQSALNEPAPTARSVPRADAAPRPEGKTVTDGTDAADGTEGKEVVRHVGKGLAELRKARDEIQRSLRVDLDDEGDGGRSTAG
jgi:sec-independent protein translocase protein TatA